jgi:hypothetical protein
MRVQRRQVLSVLALSISAVLPLAGQRPHPDSLRDDRAFSFYGRGPYRPSVPRPDSLLGYAIGSWHTQYEWQQRTLLAIADAARDRVRVETIGTTAEKRTMRIFIVSAPENIARLDAIRADLDAIADPRGKSPAELAAIVARTPAVVWFSGSVHGDEVPGFEASMPLLHHFAASTDERTMAALRNAIVIINPASNPDGHERFSVWSNSIAVGSPERTALEQQRGQPWSISGRFNHYRFDMNRDLMAVTQQEVQAIVGGMLRWHPMVTADLHGYTTQYYMAPAARPVNQNISRFPFRWSEIIGKGNAEAFDQFGWLYYVRDQFDLYYPGYYDSWPSLNGAMGATYETDGGPALLKRRPDGTLLSLRDGIAKHFVASIATLETTAGRARERVQEYLAFRQEAVSAGRGTGMQRVVWVPGADPVRAASLAAALQRGGIEVHRATSGFSSLRARGYMDAASAPRQFPAGAYVVDLAQPQGRLARALLELDPQLDPVFAKAQLDKFARNTNRSAAQESDGYEFYDITAWALPVAFGVDAWWTDDAAAATLERLAAPGTDAPRIMGERLPVSITGGIVDGKGARSSYLWRNDRQGASRLAAQLMQDGYKLAMTTESIETGTTAWPRGTWVARVSRNDATLEARIDALAREAGVEVRGANTAFPEAAQYGTGSESTVALEAPRIAMVGDAGVDLTSYGALWFSLERRYGIKFTPVSWDVLNGDLTAFNVIILPDGFGAQRLGRAENLKTWMRNGGTLITMGGSTAWAVSEAAGVSTARPVGADSSKKGAKDVPVVAPFDSLQAVKSPNATSDRPAPIPGSYFDIVLDRTHWLTLGLTAQRQTVLFGGNLFLTLSKEGANVGVFPTTGTLRRAGFVFGEQSERLLKGTAYLIDERVGRGHLVAFADAPVFRGWWRALDTLFLNAVLLGPSF